MQMHDWSLTEAPETTTPTPHDISLRHHLRIEQFRQRVSQALASTTCRPQSPTAGRERLPLYRLLNASFSELEKGISGSPRKWRLFFFTVLYLHAYVA